MGYGKWNDNFKWYLVSDITTSQTTTTTDEPTTTPTTTSPPGTLSDICSLNEQRRTMPGNISARRMKIQLILFQRVFYKMFKQYHRTYLFSFVYQDVWRRRTSIIVETLCPQWRSLMWIAVGHYAVAWVHPISVTMTKWNAGAKLQMLAEEPWLVLWAGRHRVTILQINQQPLHQVIYLAISFAIRPKKWQGICKKEQMNMNNQHII